MTPSATQLRCRRGFTLTELLLGIVISSMTLGALAALAMAVGQEWENSAPKYWQNPNATPIRVSSYQSTARIENIIKHARYLGWAGVKSDGSGSAAFLWMNDDVRSGEVNLCEVVLLDYVAATGILTMYQVPTTASNATDNLTFPRINSENRVAEFKARSNVPESAKVVLRNVVRFVPAACNVSDATMRPSLEYVLEVRAGSRNRCEYRAVGLRSPSDQPS
ncbi:MAG: prepilin-type N-terminal cleavage/methylation domain-containing protein [Planctomycetota bacterium]|nr:prepilin-type N-terminal cleavage/methylation domain-containing protein [Planctomycetota bacterium]